MFVLAPWFLFGKAGCSNSEMSGGFGRDRRSFLAYFVIFHMAQSKPTWEGLQGGFSELLGKVWCGFAARLFSHPLPHLAAPAVTEQRVMGQQLKPEIFLVFGSRGFEWKPLLWRC